MVSKKEIPKAFWFLIGIAIILILALVFAIFFENFFDKEQDSNDQLPSKAEAKNDFSLYCKNIYSSSLKDKNNEKVRGEIISWTANSDKYSLWLKNNNSFSKFHIDFLKEKEVELSLESTYSVFCNDNKTYNCISVINRDTASDIDYKFLNNNSLQGFLSYNNKTLFFFENNRGDLSISEFIASCGDSLSIDSLSGGTFDNNNKLIVSNNEFINFYNLKDNLQLSELFSAKNPIKQLALVDGRFVEVDACYLPSNKDINILDVGFGNVFINLQDGIFSKNIFSFQIKGLDLVNKREVLTENKAPFINAGMIDEKNYYTVQSKPFHSDKYISIVGDVSGSLKESSFLGFDDLIIEKQNTKDVFLLKKNATMFSGASLYLTHNKAKEPLGLDGILVGKFDTLLWHYNLGRLYTYYSDEDNYSYVSIFECNF